MLGRKKSNDNLSIIHLNPKNNQWISGSSGEFETMDDQKNERIAIEQMM